MECGDTIIYPKGLWVATQALVIRDSCILPKLISARQSLQKLSDSLPPYSNHLATRNPLTSAWEIQANIYY